MEQSSEQPITVDKLPEDPLRMPPPYWRSSSAIFHIIEALEELLSLLPVLVTTLESTSDALTEFFDQHPEEELSEGAFGEFSDIIEDLSEIEAKIKHRSERAILMSAIQAEDEINQFCVYNTHKNIAESLEKLSPLEKLIVASTVLGAPNVKGLAVYESLKKLTSWRNAFAHGHCVDRPTTSLRHNHLIVPPEYPGVPSSIRDVRDYVSAYIRLDDYIREISINPYTTGASYEVGVLRQLLDDLSRFQFAGSNTVYTVEVRTKASGSRRKRTGRVAD